LAGGSEALHSAGAGRGTASHGRLTATKGRLHVAAAGLGWAFTLAAFWPGVALYDTVEQYRQVLGNSYDDWHPPVMARLWSLFAGWWPGTAPMFVLQTSLYWLGLGLLAAACARRGSARTAWLVVAPGAFFLLSCWLGAVLKDGQMVAALMAATGLAAWHDLAGRPRPGWALASILVLLAYATLVRANAVFATVPLGLLLFDRGRLTFRAGIAVGLAATLAILVAAPPVNRYLFRAEPSGVEKSLPIFDLAGIAARTPGNGSAAAGECYSPVEWERAGEPGCPGFALLGQPDDRVARLWLAAIFDHPAAYAAHRLGHFDRTMRLFVPAGLPHAVAPVESEPNRLGLGGRPNPAA
jgi:hypothetical protein